MEILESPPSREKHYLYGQKHPMMKKIAPGLLVTLILCYFTEGFVDIVGIATNMVQQDMAQNQTRASLMPS